LDECVEDRTGLQSAAPRAHCKKGLQGGSDLAKLFDLALDLVELVCRLLADIRAVGVGVGAQRQQLLDLSEREADLLRLTNELDSLDLLRRNTRKPESGGFAGCWISPRRS
jgi:hypothetical protein